MRQATLASVSFERYGKITRRAAFLAEIEQVVPWRKTGQRPPAGWAGADAEHLLPAAVVQSVTPCRHRSGS